MAARYFRSATSAGTYESMIGSDFCFQNPEDRDARIRVCRAELRCTGWHSGSCLLCLLAVAAHTHHKRAVVHQEIGRCPIGAAVTNALNLFLFYAGQCTVVYFHSCVYITCVLPKPRAPGFRWHFNSGFRRSLNIQRNRLAVSVECPTEQRLQRIPQQCPALAADQHACTHPRLRFG